MPLSCSSAYKWYSPLSSPLCIDFSVSESFPALRYSPKHCIFLAAPLRQEDPSSPTGGLNFLLQWKYEVLTTGPPGNSPNFPPFIGTTVTLG